MDKTLFSLSPEVETALAANQPIVALESTVIAHGLPSPQNLHTAQRLEQIVQEAGVVPATIAILAGRLCVGLTEDRIRFIAEEKEIKKATSYRHQLTTK